MIVERNSISNSYIVNSVSSEYYGLKLPKGSKSIGVLAVSEQDNWELVLDVKPKFKVGDRIRKKGGTSTYTITDVSNAHYFCGKYIICDTCDNNWELVPQQI